MILVVEDDSSIRSTLSDILKLEGFETVEAANGHEALRALADPLPKSVPCVIFLDLLMPVMDGRKFLSELERSGCLGEQKVPVIVTSASALSDKELALPFVTKLLRKPLDIDDVLDTVRQYCA